MARHDFAGAIKDLTRACELEPSVADHRYRRAQAYLRQGQGDLALADLDHALQMNPLDPEALIPRLRVRPRSADADAERRDLETMDRVLAQSDSARLDLGQHALRWELYPAAVTQFSAWLATHETGADAASTLNNRCWARALGDFELDAALADCNQALKLNAHAWSAYRSRGLVHVRRHEDALALEDFDADLRMNPKSAWDLYLRGLVRLRQGKKVESQVDIDAALAIDPKVPLRTQRIGLASKTPDAPQMNLDAGTPK